MTFPVAENAIGESALRKACELFSRIKTLRVRLAANESVNDKTLEIGFDNHIENLLGKLGSSHLFLPKCFYPRNF